jgi:hypothetical protein
VEKIEVSLKDSERSKFRDLRSRDVVFESRQEYHTDIFRGFSRSVNANDGVLP